ncbi:mitotic spindle assembly checkpoint protein MAD1 [Ciona intestinalis]
MEQRFALGMTPDNTKVMRIMGEFHDFMSAAKENSMQQSSHISAIPFSLPSDDDHRQSTALQVSNVLSKVKLKQLESSHSSSEKLLIQRTVSLESKIKELEMEKQKLLERCSKYQVQVTDLTQQSIDLSDKVKDLEQTKHDEISKWEESAMEIHRLKQQNDQKLAMQTQMLNERINDLMSQKLTMEKEEQLFEINQAELCSQVEQYKSQAQAAFQLQAKYDEKTNQLLQAEHTIHELKMRLENVQEAENMAHILKQDMNRLRQLEIDVSHLSRENSNLKLNQENCALLKEQLIAANTKLQRLEEKCNEIPKVVAENEALKAKLNKTQNATSANVDDNTSPMQNHSSFNAKLEKEVESLKEQLATSKNRSFEDRKNAAEYEMKFTEQTEVISSLKAQLIRLKKRASLFAYERDSIRSLLQTYDAELTMTSHTTQLNKRLDNMTSVNKKLHDRIVELELESQRHVEDTLRHKLQVKQMQLGGSLSLGQKQEIMSISLVLEEKSNELLALKEKITLFETERTNLMEKIANLEAWIEQRNLNGDYNPDKTKVLHFTMNPADLAHQQSKRDITELKEQNAKLQLKLRQLEEGHEVSMSEIEFSKEAKTKLNAAELKNQRLKEVFSKKIQEFRQVCYSLMGFQVVCSSDGKFKLLSMYADSETDCLEFEVKTSGEIELLETEYTKTLTDLISLHLHHQNSIPMFLSALTVNLYGQQTMMAD